MDAVTEPLSERDIQLRVIWTRRHPHDRSLHVWVGVPGGVLPSEAAAAVRWWADSLLEKHYGEEVDDGEYKEEIQ